MTTSSALLDRAATAAGERAGRDLKQWRSATELTHLSASKVKGVLESTGAEGGTLFADVPILKAGQFHGGFVVIDEADLAAMVARFGQLAPDVFVPPVRIDHSWNVLNVIGHIASLRVEVRADASNGGVDTAFLLADLQILDDTALDLIKKGILRNRSSEIGPYEANTGQVHSLVMWGVAFVDIPAVEGLGNVELGRATPGLGAPHTVTELTEGGHVADDQSDEQSDEQDTEQTEQETSEAASGQGDGSDDDDQGSQAQQDDAGEAGAAASTEDGQDDQGSDDSDDSGGEDVGSDAGAHDAQDAAAGALAAARASLGLREGMTPEQVLRSLGLTAQADQLAKDDADAVEAQLRAYGQRGVLGKAAHTPARALLGHADPSVRALARTLLDNAVAPVKLGKDAGKQSSETASGSRGDDAAVTVAMLAKAEDLEELSDLFAAMPLEARKDRNHELSKAFAERRRQLADS